MSDEIRFTVCTFKRLYKLVPQHDRLTLAELVDGLTRFQRRPKLHRQYQRDIDRIEAAWAAWSAGEEGSGRPWSRIVEAAREAERAGDDPAAAAAHARGVLRGEVGKQVKMDFRVWSPAAYVPGGERRKEDVAQLSCLVLDYDGGATIEDARDQWFSWFHVMHTTWSHTAEVNKFRVVLPLAQPAPAASWYDVWRWVHEIAGDTVDPTGKSVSRAYALPVVPHDAWPRAAYVHQAELLDLSLEGVPGASEPPNEVDAGPGLLRHDREMLYLASARTLQETRLEAEDTWDLFGDDPLAAVETVETDPARVAEASTAAPTEVVDALRDRIAALEERLALAERRLGLAELDRLAAMVERGTLTAEAFERAKELILADPGALR